MIIELKNGVYWVGIVDWHLRHFHGHELSTHRGSTYNSYLIIDKKNVLIDTVWNPFQDQLIENIKEIIDPSQIDYVVANHAENDHSGSLEKVMQCAPNATIIVSSRGEESIKGHFHKNWNFKKVKTQECLNIGTKDLVFFEAPMLHWPDTMFTYLTNDNILMSSDAFGQHYASNFRFNDQVNNEELYEEALKYFANILTPFSNLVFKKIDEILSYKLKISMIAPSHGIIWRSDINKLIDNYRLWALQKLNKSAVILFDSMWNGTRKMAENISNGLTEYKISNKIFNLSLTDRNDLITEIFKAKAIIIGSPTFNNGLLPSIMPILEDLRGLKFQHKIGAAFGTYGWSGEALNIIENHLKCCNIEIICPGIKSKWNPSVSELERCKNLGKTIAEAISANF